ncbi:transporter [Rhodoblastus acidophilus]|uniref:Transporter n=1 Tax=Candidatus Rhodoblastus alkanivorans TaxID=2954117 RepID=A0ABS9Z2H5_9HYPH|nr:transporter [Candidatus Rhodoblastus alkanivorans]MCI4678015.1 transporter [Candidatus Rhodoblastus alkanivorans]MCI4681645.1 transporter [Candidatus Rhodoblastus alkanivorans]MDI4642692.1 transporter [Rhodoblastus acidophilus]
MKTTKMKLRRLALGAGLTAPFAACAPAQASDITFAVIGPQEYNLPVNFQPFNVFVQYGEYNSQAQAWSPLGGLYPTTNSNLFVGLSKYVRFFTLDGLPNVGLAYEIIVPEVLVTLPGGSVGGIGDPLTGPAVWIKPNSNSTFGVQSFVQFPVGNTDVSNHYWANYSTIFFDWQSTLLSFTGDSGAVFRSIQTAPGAPRINEGTTLFTNLRLGWKATKFWEPFVAFDWQTTAAANYANGGGVAAPANAETALGVGVMAHFSDAASLTVRYSHDIQGYNTIGTNGAYMKFAYVW